MTEGAASGKPFPDVADELAEILATVYAAYAPEMTQPGSARSVFNGIFAMTDAKFPGVADQFTHHLNERLKR